MSLAAVCSWVAAFIFRLAFALPFLWLGLRGVSQYPRKVVEIRWRDLASVLLYLVQELFGLGGTGRSRAQSLLERQWSPRGDALAFLCVRSAFDVFLEALALPKGSEVLFVPGITIPSMVKLVEARGLVPRGLEPKSASEMIPPAEELQHHLTENTRVVVVTHLFGAVFDQARPLMAEAQQRGLVVFEDCAQAFVEGPQGFRGHQEADASFVSFGLIKTMTCMGGSLGHVRDAELRKKMTAIHQQLPVQTNRNYLSKVVKAIAFKVFSWPCLWGLVSSCLHMMGVSFDSLIIDSVRGFPAGTGYRVRPCTALLRLLSRRLTEQAASFAVGRQQSGKRVARRLLDAGMHVLGHGQKQEAWWLVPVLHDEPERLVHTLVSSGFDATCSSSQLAAVASVSGKPAATGLTGSQLIMRKVVYLPCSKRLSLAAMDRLADAVLQSRASCLSPEKTALRRGLPMARGARSGLLLIFAALLLFLRPSLALWFLPSRRMVGLALLLFASVTLLAVTLGRRLAATPGVKPSREVLKAFAPNPRVEGVEFWRGQPAINGRVDGAVLMTGATGFVGGGILFGMLSRAKELGITKIVLLVRKKAGVTMQSRLQELRADVALIEVQELFDQYVVGMEGDVAMEDFGCGVDGDREWPHDEPLKVVMHCAGDVRFTQPLQEAALSIISGTLQVVQQAARWKAERLVFVSTAFVHPVPSAGDALQERLVDLRDFDPMELYRDAVNHGRWAEKAMRHLGFPNTYTFSKAVAEHLVTRTCAASNVACHIIRPSIVGPAWAAPYAGWCGNAPSTIVGATCLVVKRVCRVFLDGDHPAPVVPVDMVAGAALEAMAGPAQTIIQATLDASESDRMHSIRETQRLLHQVMALRGTFSLAELGLLSRLRRRSENERIYWLIHTTLDLWPAIALQAATSAIAAVAAFCGWIPGIDAKRWDKLSGKAKALRKVVDLPTQYKPFIKPQVAWRFKSGRRLPENFDTMEYTMMIFRGALTFAETDLRTGPQPGAASAFRELRVASTGGSLLGEWFEAFSSPGAPLTQSLAMFLVRRGLGWVDLKVMVDLSALHAATLGTDALVLCPQHRSLLDFVIVGAACFQLAPLVPRLKLPSAAADSEFSRLPVLGKVLANLGAFFVRRGGKFGQPDPGLQSEVARVFNSNRPMELFLEGLRSRGRRQLRLRTGLLKALRDVAQRRVALVPIGLSYELLPEDHSFYNELCGNPRPPLSTLALLSWVRRGVNGELPSLGDARVRFGTMHTFDEKTDIPQTLEDLQDELVDLTCVTELHARALAEVLTLKREDVIKALEAAGIAVLPTRLSRSGAEQLPDAERWPMALQVATKLRKRLPDSWSWWLVEPVSEKSLKAQTADTPVNGVKQIKDGAEPHINGKVLGMPAADAKEDEPRCLQALMDAFTLQLKTAEDVAMRTAEALQAGGTVAVSQEHLLQQLLKPSMAGDLPPALAKGAASIVTAKLSPTGFIPRVGSKSRLDHGKATSQTAAASGPITPLWTEKSRVATKSSHSDAESLDRWGFKDTRFMVQNVDGQPAVKVSSERYGALGGKPLPKILPFFQEHLGMTINVSEPPMELPLPKLAPPADGLETRLSSVLPAERIRTDVEARLRAGTGHGLQDIWKLRTREVGRMPDAVVRPETEEEVIALLKAAACCSTAEESTPSSKRGPFAVIPVGGRTNVTSATAVPPKEVDPRPFVSLDMKGLNKVRWVNAEDGVAMIEAGMTGKELQAALKAHGLNMGMEPDSMEWSTLGGWIATRASGMKRARYGNIEEMIVEVRVATPDGIMWQHHDCPAGAPQASQTAFGRVSTNSALPSMLLGSEGCLGVVVAAVVRVSPLPEVVEYDSVVFPDWEHGTQWMRSVARLPRALRPASSRLMDSKQLGLATAIKDDGSSSQLKAFLKTSVLRMRGVRLQEAAAATIVYEGSRDEVAMQKRALAPLVKRAGGVRGGSSSGAAGYALTFAIAYLRDFALDYGILSESLETLAPWSKVEGVWPAVVAAVEKEHHAWQLPGKPWLSCRMTQIYDEGAVLYMYLAVSTVGLKPSRAVEAFQALEHAARAAAVAAGGCLSHHHGVGKLRAPLLPDTQSPALSSALLGLKTAFDPHNVLAARNGAWNTAESVQKTKGA
eukprot:TRINITY_DN1747_c0_g4_i1.p1 TRINITY_DN1747_c0_g4~~TRINITY_DN1747_c0_g4_i1.p1  ORF type:complete len:2129 (+),score=480.49 TRINITY_DN1747_c0_g4_i1:110-6496(+)